MLEPVIQEHRQIKADNPANRDFRQVTIGNTWTSSVLTQQSPGVYIANPGKPSVGWRSYFVEVVYDFSGPFPGLLDEYDYHFTTEMRVLPEIRPFEADFDRDTQTDLWDVDILAYYWLSDNPYRDVFPRRSGDGIINLQDFGIMGIHWLQSP